jgi:hypothetical protein
LARPRPFERLSQYGLFAGEPAAQEPAKGVVPYDLNSALFSDYAVKHRFIELPAGTRATYREHDAFEFPVGTVIAKTFAYPRDARDPAKGRRLIETRILKREPDGWVGLPYIWNAAQTDAMLDVAGDTVDVSGVHTDGSTRTNNYIIPNSNQCKGCHKAGDAVVPIGPKARHLNRDFAYREGTENQLAHWSRLGMLWPARLPRMKRLGWPPGTTPRPARSTPAPAPGWRSTAPTATTPKAPRATPGSTCSPPSGTQRLSASSRPPCPPASAQAGDCTTSSPASRTSPSCRTGSPRPTPAS